MVHPYEYTAFHSNHHHHFTREDGTQMITRMFKTCRMYFGDAMVYDSSGENNLTGGMILQLEPKIVFIGMGFRDTLQEGIIQG